MVIVLDTCDHLVPAAPQLVQLLARAPGLRILATSRATLRVSGEHVYQVAPLCGPDPDALARVGRATRAMDPARFAELSTTPAIALFADRARASLPEFRLSAANIAVVGRIVARLDCLPLAIELAAARCGMLSLEALLQRLDRRLALLVDGSPDLPERQRTLRNAIAWSYGLLGPEEQWLFRNLAPFEGGCTLDIAPTGPRPTEGARGGGIPAHEDVLARLATLVSSGLLLRTVDRDGTPRFRMLDTVREFAVDELIAMREDPDARRRFAQSMLVLAQRVELRGPLQGAWGQRAGLGLSGWLFGAVSDRIGRRAVLIPGTMFARLLETAVVPAASVRPPPQTPAPRPKSPHA